MTLQTATQIPAGWYPDPQGSFQQRWWDGGAWTNEFAQYRPTRNYTPHVKQPVEAQIPVYATAPATPLNPPAPRADLLGTAPVIDQVATPPEPVVQQPDPIEPPQPIVYEAAPLQPTSPDQLLRVQPAGSSAAPVAPSALEPDPIFDRPATVNPSAPARHVLFNESVDVFSTAPASPTVSITPAASVAAAPEVLPVVPAAVPTPSSVPTTSSAAPSAPAGGPKAPVSPAAVAGGSNLEGGVPTFGGAAAVESADRDAIDAGYKPFGYTARSIAPKVTAAPTRSYTVAAWILAIVPALGAGAAVAIAYYVPLLYTVFAVSIIGVVTLALLVGLGYADSARLRFRGHEQTVPGILAALGPVYFIARAYVVAKQTGRPAIWLLVLSLLVCGAIAAAWFVVPGLAALVTTLSI